METVIAWAGFIGGWLLVAGPLFQAAVELRELEVDRAGISAATSSVAPPPISNWWWLLPPVAYLKLRRRSRLHRAAVLDALTTEQRGQMVGFMNKANGWLTVSIGAAFIAIKETWELHEVGEWPLWLFWLFVVAMPLLSVLSVAVRMQRGDHIAQADDARRS